LVVLSKNIKRFFSCKRELLIVILVAVISLGAGFGTFEYLKKDVIINDNGTLISFKTMKNTFGEALEQKDIDVSEHDYTSVSLESDLRRAEENKIYIKRAVPVYITADGRVTKVMTYKDTVAEMLEDSPVKPQGLDRISGAALDDKVEAFMSLEIVRVNESILYEQEPIPYETKRVANSRLDEGFERVATVGQEGICEKKYKVVTENGMEISRELLGETILKNAVNAVVEYGTVMNKLTSRGEKLRYSKVLDMKATAYTASLKDTGKSPEHPLFGITATGIKAKKGVIAVDPKVIPLYTKVYVEIIGSTPDYGYAIAADVGGAIKGNKIDLYYDSQEYVDKFGVKKVRVYILADQ